MLTRQYRLSIFAMNEPDEICDVFRPGKSVDELTIDGCFTSLDNLDCSGNIAKFCCISCLLQSDCIFHFS